MRTILFAFVLVAAACGGSSSTPGSCRIPDSIAGDAAAGDCSGSPTFEECQDNGDGTQSCSNLCHDGEFSLHCTHDAQAPASLGSCRVLPLPTPEGVTFYCCPCD